jgi:hypothetical protein
MKLIDNQILPITVQILVNMPLMDGFQLAQKLLQKDVKQDHM